MSSQKSVPERHWELLDRHRPELIAQAAAILGNREDAEDVVQETLCEVFRDEHKAAQMGSDSELLRLINRRNALNHLRTRQRAAHKVKQKQQALPVDMFTTGGFSVLELRESVKTALDKLPEKLRTVVQLRYWQNLSYKDIAREMNLPVGSVGGLLLEAGLQLYDDLRPKLERK